MLLSRRRVPVGTPASPGTLIRFEDVARSFGEVRAVDGVSLDIAEGAFLCLLGPSGCGKSTLLRLLAGFERPDRGRILLDGADISDEPPHRRPLNMMFQSYALFPHLSVAGNIAYGLKRLGAGRAEIASRVDEMLRLVRLDGLGQRMPAQISGGQRQRAALARALARRPRVLLLDEPLAALDRRLREETRAELKALQARLGTTFVMVTHDQEEAMGLADRLAVMDRGRLVQVGTPRDAYERPANRFVAEFLGDVNLVEGRAEGEGDRVGVATALCAAPLKVADSERTRPGHPVTLAVRPERVLLLEEGPAGENELGGEIVETTYLGPTTLLRVRLADGSVWRVSHPAASGPVPEAGSIRLRVPPDAAVPLG